MNAMIRYEMIPGITIIGMGWVFLGTCEIVLRLDYLGIHSFITGIFIAPIEMLDVSPNSR